MCNDMSLTRETNVLSDSSILDLSSHADCSPEQLLHDLQLRHAELEFKLIELDVQNEHLRTIQARHEESNSYLADLFNNAPIGYLTLSDKGLISGANLTAAKLFRIDREDLLSCHFSTLLTAQDSDRWYLFCRELKNHKQQGTITLSIKACDDTEMIVRLDCLRINSTLRITLSDLTTTIVTDISQVKAANDGLKDLVTLNFILNNTPVLIGYWDKHLKNQFSNWAYSRWFGKTPQQIKGKSLRQTIGEQLYAENLPHINSVMQGESQLFDRHIPSPDPNKTIHTQLSYLPHIINGQVEGFYVLGIDITDKDNLHETRFQKRAIFETLNQGVIITDTNKKITYINQAIRQLTGYSAEEMLGKSCDLLQGKNTDPQLILQMRESLNQCKAFKGEIINYRKDGSEFWNELVISPIFDSHGNLSQFVSFQNDISERKHLEADLIASEQGFKNLAQAKSDFLAYMSHEIRTPMNGVLGMLDLLSETELSALQQNWLGTAHSSGQALLEIINDILDLSKLEADQVEIESVSFNLVELIDEVCALLALRAHEKGLELNCELAAILTPVWQGDPLRIRQVLTNLIGNALKFTEQGEVSICVMPLPESPHQLRFEIRDTGIGISEENQSRLFKSFSQAESSTSRLFGGTGLGLSISKKLVDLMGGTIGVDSIENQATCFWFTLPLKQTEALPATELRIDLSGKRALIADENATNRNILRHYLNSWGLSVNEAVDGTSALIELQTSASQGVNYDLILLDMQMPIMDGLTLAKCLVQIPAFANIPIILLSSINQLKLAEYENTSIVECLLKPARQSQLFNAVGNALQCISQIPYKSALIELETPNYQDKKVLVVEDNQINQKVIVAKLAKFKIVPDLAENGALAVSKLEQNTYDLIFMDCQMPVMDGYVTTRELRLLETRLGLPHQTVIALTANALNGDSEKCLTAGMDDYLTKPIISEHLKDILVLYLGKSSSEIAPILADKNSSLPVWDKVATLNHLDEDSDLLFEMIDLLLKESPKQLQSLLLFLADGNLPELAKTAHLIKGIVDHFYAITARDCAYLLEQTALYGQPADYQSMTQALINAVTELMSELRLTRTS